MTEREISSPKSKIRQPGGSGHTEWQQLWYSSVDEFQKLTEPLLDNTTETNLTVPLGSTAYLHCRVRNLGERTLFCERSFLEIHRKKQMKKRITV
ncbi:junctional adhesion molecule A-like [Aphis craccivora]|uniref:Junctional adhesion molecule A-like n=1 Tax=Aphis craccivora TaxID=307492 RepID=A0A6G0YDX3_APHCR|nr:junctional adhesion molecule A-like [Aphis craccivora]